MLQKQYQTSTSGGESPQSDDYRTFTSEVPLPERGERRHPRAEHRNSAHSE
jgi:hypothetical protein